MWTPKVDNRDGRNDAVNGIKVARAMAKLAAVASAVTQAQAARALTKRAVEGAKLRIAKSYIGDVHQKMRSRDYGSTGVDSDSIDAIRKLQSIGPMEPLSLHPKRESFFTVAKNAGARAVKALPGTAQGSVTLPAENFEPYKELEASGDFSSEGVPSQTVTLGASPPQSSYIRAAQLPPNSNNVEYQLAAIKQALAPQNAKNNLRALDDNDEE